MNAYVVSYKGMMMLWYRTVNGRAHLLCDNANKFSGTPMATVLTNKVVKTILAKEFNHNWYVDTKQGVFSCSTGNKIVDPKIHAIFDK